MPELPEVETIRRGLEKAVVNQTLLTVRVIRHDLRIPVPTDFTETFTKKQCLSLKRRGKYILLFFDQTPAMCLHLGMSGRIRIHQPSEKLVLQKHDHIVLKTENGTHIVYHDPRRFGFLMTIDSKNWEKTKPFALMGPEPLEDWSGDMLHNALKSKLAPIKTALLDQSIVSGFGNIYVCEALFDAKISPTRAAKSLSAVDCERLVACGRNVLEKAIAAGGSTLRDYQQTDGGLGYFQYQFSVYDQEGKPCPDKQCTGQIIRIAQGGRSTFTCPTCQK